MKRSLVPTQMKTDSRKLSNWKSVQWNQPQSHQQNQPKVKIGLRWWEKRPTVFQTILTSKKAVRLRSNKSITVKFRWRKKQFNRKCKKRNMHQTFWMKTHTSLRSLLNSFALCKICLEHRFQCKWILKWQQASQVLSASLYQIYQRKLMPMISAPCKCSSRPKVEPINPTFKLYRSNLLRSALTFKTSAQCNGCSIQWIRVLHRQ